MVWPGGGHLDELSDAASDYTVHLQVERPAFQQVQASIGFAVTDDVWDTVTGRLVSDAMVFARTRKTREPVAVAVAERRSDGWVEIGWVAVAPAHRGNGLGAVVCASLTRHLLAAGEVRLFGSTHDHRLAALSIYFALGFHPVYRAEKHQRWRAVCRRLQVPFSPDEWGWPPENTGR